MFRPGEIHLAPITENSQRWKKGYRVEVRFSHQGELRRKVFRSTEDASAWVAEWREELVKGGQFASITDAERIAVMEFRADLAHMGVGLREALQEGVRVLSSRKRAITVQRLIDARLADLRKLSGGQAPHYLNTRTRLTRFGERFGSLSVAEVTPADLVDWLGSMKGAQTTRVNYRKTLHALFSDAMARGYLEKNPVDRVKTPNVLDGEIGILSVDQARDVLGLAREENCLGPVAIGLFAGLRVSEVDRLEPDDVQVGRGFVKVVRGKTRASRRIVDLEPAAVAWLSTCDPLAGQGRLVRRRFLRRLPISWPANALRHSFASYHLAAMRDLARLATLMGNSPDIIRRHYAEMVTPEEAAAFWALRP